MLGKATPKIGDQVDGLVGNIQKKLCWGEGGEHMKSENRREKMVYIFDFRFDLDDWVHAEGKVLDGPTHARITGCRFTPRGRLFRHPRLTGILQCRQCTFSNLKTQHIHRTNNDCCFYFHLAGGPG